MTIIKRNLFKELKSHSKEKEISLIVGPRQVGKTFLMLLLKDFLEKQGQPIVFLNLDIESDRQFFSSQGKLVKKIRLEIGNERGYVFIDEIQRKEDAGLFLKGLYDMRLPYKFIVSGSGSLELKEKIHESLMGRKRIFELNPLSFDEFINFKTDYKYEGKFAKFFELEQEKTRELLEEYLNFGGYPRVILEQKEEEKTRIIAEIYNSYMEKDISYLLGVKKEEAFTRLLRIIASQAGSLTNFSELSSTVGISHKTVTDYIWYLEKTYILQRVSPYFKNFRKEITKSPIFYFYDLGLRNYALGEFGNIVLPKAGFLFQNMIFNILKESVRFTPVHINFWRTKDGAEVDFIMTVRDKIIPIEVKASKLKESKINKSLRSFINKYQPKNVYLVSLESGKKIMIDKTLVHFIPFYEASKIVTDMS
jgi:predicted AAA+ superfamily ATPase